MNSQRKTTIQFRVEILRYISISEESVNMIRLLDFLVGDCQTDDVRYWIHDQLLRMINRGLIRIYSSGILDLPSVITGNDIAEKTDATGTLVFSSRDFARMPSDEIIERIESFLYYYD